MRGPDPWGAGRAWLQPVATGRKSARPKNASNMPKLLPSVATACRVERMVRRGSMVRVRQRALQKAPQSGAFLVGATCVVPMCGTCGARYGAFKSTWRFDDRETGPSRDHNVKDRAMVVRRKWASGAATPWPRHRKGPSDAKKTYAWRSPRTSARRRLSAADGLSVLDPFCRAGGLSERFRQAGSAFVFALTTTQQSSSQVAGVQELVPVRFRDRPCLADPALDPD